MNFKELYLLACELCKEEPSYEMHYQDIDDCMQYLEDNNLIHSFLDRGYLLLYEDFQFKEFLSHQYIFEGKEYILYFPIEIDLIQMMTDNRKKKLNKWKLDCIEKVLLHGWDHFKELYLRRIL